MRHDLRLFLPVLVAWAATAAAVGIPEYGYRIALGCAILTAILVLFLLIRARLGNSSPPEHPSLIQVIALALLLSTSLTAVLSFRVGFEHDLRSPKILTEAVIPGSVIHWRGFATSSPEKQQNTSEWNENTQFTATVNSVTVQGREVTVSIPVRVSADAVSTANVKIGSAVSFSGSAKPMPASASIAYAVNARELHAGEPHPVLSVTDHLRTVLRDAARMHEGWGAELIPGLAVGDTELVSTELDSAMKMSSLSHLTAVSGANCAIITGLVLTAGRALRVPRRMRIGFAALFLAMFVALVTPEPSVLRAAVMSVVTMVSTLSSRKGAGVAALALAILALLILDPWQAQHLGFVLSVLATAGIILFTEPIAQRLRKWMPNWLALVFAVPVAAQLACQPAIILMQPSLPTFGVLANVLAAPAAPIATVVGLVACVSLPIAPWLGEFAVWLTWWPASWIANIAAAVDSLPAAQLPWLSGWGGALLLAMITIIVLIAMFARTRSRTQSSHTLRWVAGTLALSLLLAISVVRPLTVMALLPSNWRVFVCDVGQGDAVLVRGSAGIMLIDTGIDPKGVDECLDLLSISRIDVLVLTHDDNDHIGGVSGVLDRVDTAIVSPSDENPRPVLTILRNAEVRAVIGERGMRGTLGDLNWQILWPLPGKTTASTNDASVVVRIDAPELSALFLGDLGEQAQQQLMRTVALTPVDVVKVAHHGSADQSFELYRTIRAHYGIISVGADNGYGHPTHTLLGYLRRSKTLALRTDSQGALAIARDPGGKWRLWGRSPVG